MHAWQANRATSARGGLPVGISRTLPSRHCVMAGNADNLAVPEIPLPPNGRLDPGDGHDVVRGLLRARRQKAGVGRRRHEERRRCECVFHRLLDSVAEVGGRFRCDLDPRGQGCVMDVISASYLLRSRQTVDIAR